MYDIEPHYFWRDDYIASEDENSPFFRRENSEFYFENKIYNYFIHPQWDPFGSPTLYMKALFVDYDEGFAILEMFGEWNDCIHNDVMFLKRNIAEPMMEKGIKKFILICENVLNFHGDDDCYYEEWSEELTEEGGYIALVNTLQHVEEEMNSTWLDNYLSFGHQFNNLNWRKLKPQQLVMKVEEILMRQTKRLGL
ncbi:MAG: hypothetical protein EA409_03470 [Saprospirales bacterium]|nr:MAG: hypothetical protein EA409_03470 [Saprospirales bacterium]